MNICVQLSYFGCFNKSKSYHLSNIFQPNEDRNLLEEAQGYEPKGTFIPPVIKVCLQYPICLHVYNNDFIKSSLMSVDFYTLDKLVLSSIQVFNIWLILSSKHRRLKSLPQ